MFGLGFGEILLILLAALVFIGPKKLPELSRSLGKGLREFQKAKDGLMNSIETETNKGYDFNQDIITKTSEEVPNGQDVHSDVKAKSSEDTSNTTSQS
jgi:sec-independent protein translocase protein TatA